MKTDYILDTVGKFCPVPIIETATKIKELDVGDTITVISDDSGFFPDMRNWSKLTGHEYIDDSADDGIYTVYIRKVKS